MPETGVGQRRDKASIPASDQFVDSPAFDCAGDRPRPRQSRPVTVARFGRVDDAGARWRHYRQRQFFCIAFMTVSDLCVAQYLPMTFRFRST